MTPETLLHRLRALLALGVLFLGGCGGSPESRRILEAARSGGRAYEKLAWLTDRIGPRLSGSDNLDQAVRWAAAEFERDGLERVHTEKVMVPHWVRGVETARLLAPVARPLAVTALGGSIPTPEDGIEGDVIEATSFDDLHAAGDRARGKIVLFNKPIAANSPDRGYGSAVGLRSGGAVEAARAGAVGMLLRSLGTASFRLPHTGAMRYQEDVVKLPAAAIAAEDAELIHRLLASGGPVRARMVLGCRTLPDAESANVVAELRGREAPEEIVLIGAHLDSWDLATGAIDDGAGVAIVMETMRLLKSLGPAPRRTIRAVLFTNEENGLRGGRAYAEAHKEEWPRHVAAIECDSGGARPLGFGVKAGVRGVETAAYLAADLIGIGAGRVTKGGGGADIGPLGAGSVPLLGLRQDSTHYFDYHHSPADTLDKVDPRDLDLNVAAMAVMTWKLAEMDGALARPAPDDDADPHAQLPESPKPAVKRTPPTLPGQN